ncbi:MAG TPA: DJ-1/PfpI family protein [Allosphingosinicella sp.]
MRWAAAGALLLAAAAVVEVSLESGPAMASPPVASAEARPYGKIDPYRPRLGRTRPLVVVVGENSGTELTDFTIPYGILKEAGVADVLTASTRPGPIRMSPALQVRPDLNVGEFDRRYPEGADYVVVPAMEKNEDPLVTAWLAAQARKGATLVSICDGALVLANSGVMDGHRGTAHWATHALREKRYPRTTWLRNARYVADRRIVSSAGISAAVPTAIAMVEAIAGRDKAAAMARQLAVADWSNAHDSEIFRPRAGGNLAAFATIMYTNGWIHRRDQVGIPLEPGVDEIAVALAADAWSRTGRSQAYGIAASPAPVVSRHGLTILPDRAGAGPRGIDRMLRLPNRPPGEIFDDVLAQVRAAYGMKTAYGVALVFEYPWQADRGPDPALRARSQPRGPVGHLNSIERSSS